MAKIFRRFSPGLLAALSLLLASSSVAQETEKDSSRSPLPELYPIPILYYTPETGIAGGVAALYLHRDPAASLKSRPSSLKGDFIYSERKQIIVDMTGDFYSVDEVFRLLISSSFKRFPNKFYGIGNNNANDAAESYTARSFFVKVVLSKNIYSRLNAGPVVRYESSSILETKPSGLLAQKTIAGSDGGALAGMGCVVNWDNRDNTFAAYSGSFYQLTALFYRRALQSDFSCNDFQLDARNFLELFPSQVLALQCVAEVIDGTAPFQSLARYGGQDLLRGYFEGQYRDNTSIALQAEYRFPLWWRFGGVAFGGIAQVAPTVTHWRIGEFKFAGGAGLRFIFNEQDRVTLRMDAGLGKDSSGLYLTATEAF